MIVTEQEIGLDSAIEDILVEENIEPVEFGASDSDSFEEEVKAHGAPTVRVESQVTDLHCLATPFPEGARARLPNRCYQDGRPSRCIVWAVSQASFAYRTPKLQVVRRTNTAGWQAHRLPTTSAPPYCTVRKLGVAA